MDRHESSEALFHFTVREVETIDAKTGIVASDGQVAALEEKRYRVAVHRVDGVKVD